MCSRQRLKCLDSEDFWDFEERFLWGSHDELPRGSTSSSLFWLEGLGNGSVGNIGVFFVRSVSRCWEKSPKIGGLDACDLEVDFCGCSLVDSFDSAGSKNAANNHLTGWPSSVQT